MNATQLHSNGVIGNQPAPSDIPRGHEPEGLISEATLLTKLPVSRRTLVDKRKRGLIPFIKLGSRVLYNWPQVLAALERQSPRVA